MKQELDQGYYRDQQQQAADVADLHISHDRAKVEEIEERLAHAKNRQEAAKDVLQIAERVLSGAPQLEITREARCDKDEAEKVIRDTAENIQQLEEALTQVKTRLAVWEARRKEVNTVVLRAGRMLDALRNRMKGN